LRREVQEGLNVIENWNGANNFILYGKGGEIGSNDFENQEITMPALKGMLETIRTQLAV
jgi:TnpA family transposase